MKTEAIVISVTRETPDMLRIALRLKEKPSFQAGQFLMVHFGEFRRAYSIASAPYDELIELLIKLAPNGKGSQTISQWEQGHTIEVDLPFGRFTLDPSDHAPLFIATGSGIAPIRALLRSWTGRKATLLYGFRNDEDFAFGDELLAMVGEGKLALHCCITGAKDPPTTCFHGRTTDLLKDKLIVDPTTQIAYVCGLPDAVAETVAILHQLGFPKERIRKEMF